VSVCIGEDWNTHVQVDAGPLCWMYENCQSK
jgi:hypothetical protein